MLAQLIGATALVVAVSLIVGQLALALGGPKRFSWASAPVGFSVLMAVMAPAVYLPGHLIVPAIVVAALTIGGIYWMVTRPEMRPPWADLAYAMPTAILLFFPFIAAGRTGLLGVGFDNDTASHLQFLDAIRSQSNALFAGINDYYPLAPHAVMAGISSLGFGSIVGLTAVTVAVPLMTALTALSVLHRSPWWIKAPTVTLTALPYLAAGYYGQSGFKELLIVLFLIGLVGLLEDAAERDDAARFVPVAAIIAGTVSAYSYTGVAWPIAAMGLGAVAWATQFIRKGIRPLGAAIGSLAYPVTLAGLATVFLIAPQLKRIQAFYDWNTLHPITTDNLGNLAGPVPKLEMLGVWFNGDYRYAPVNLDISHAGAALVALLLLAAFIWSLLDRTRVTLALTALGTLVIALAVGGGQSPYVVAKALMLVSPFVFLLIGRAAGDGALRLPVVPRLGVLALTAVAGLLGLWSTGLALRSSQVGSSDHLHDLDALRPIIKGQRTLYLGLDDFVNWELRGAPITQPILGVQSFAFNPAKRWVYGQSLDADTVPPAAFDTFRYVITPNIASASALPENFEKVATKGVYRLYRRVGRTPSRFILDENDNGTSILNCSTSMGRRLAGDEGIAAIRGPQVVTPMTPIGARQTQTVQLRLTPGTWDLSLRYGSNRAITVTGPGLKITLPPALERVGSIWPAGALHADRTETVSLVFKPDYRAFSVDAATQIVPTQLIAQRRGTERTVPLRKACGQPVDWYRLAPTPDPQGAPR